MKTIEEKRQYEREYYRKNRRKLLDKQKIYQKKSVEKRAKYWREYYLSHKDEINEREKSYYNAEYHKRYREENKEKIKAYRKLYREANKGELKEYREKHKDHLAKYIREYRQNNQKIIYQKRKESQKIYVRERRSNDKLVRLRTNLSSRTNVAFRNIGRSKPTKTEELLGGQYDIVKSHIENQFSDGMSWDNYGKWHIDHIIPLSSAKDMDELIALCHYSNLQPLWAKDNLRKSNKIQWNQN